MRTIVVAHFLVWIFLGYSILAQSTRLDSDEDPCLRAKLKDDSRRDIANVQALPGKLLCDRALETGWYRFVLNNKSAEIPTVCLRNGLCGTQLPLRIDLDGQVLPEMNRTIDAFVCSSFSVLGMWDCCVLRQRTRIKNCGDFLVYHLNPSDRCPVSYCVQESRFVPPIGKIAEGGQPVAELEKIVVQNDDPQIQVSVSNVYDTNLTYNTILMREGNSTENYSDVTTTSMNARTNDLKCSANTNDTARIACKDGQGCGTVCDGFPDCSDTSDEIGCLEMIVCSEGRTMCPDRSRCYIKCDGVHDCSDGYDEQYCHIEKNMTFSSTRQFSLPLVTSAANLASALQDNVTVRDVIHTDTFISSTRMLSQVDVTYAIGALESVTNVLSSFDTLSSIVSLRSFMAQSQQWRGSLSDAIEITPDTSSGEMIQTISSQWNTTSAALISFIPDATSDPTVPGQFVSIVSESMAQAFSTIAVTTLLTEMVSHASFVTEELKDLSEESLSTIHLVTSFVSTSTLATATDFASAVSEVTGTSADLQSLPTAAYHLVTGSITVKPTILAEKSANGTSITSQPGQLSIQPIITTARIPTDDTEVVLTFPVQGRVVNLTDFEERLRKAMAKVLNVYLSGGLNRTKREMDMSTLEPSPQRVYKAEDIVVSSLENTTEHLIVTLQVRALSDNRSSSSFLSREELQTMLENPQAWTMLLTELELSEQEHASTTIMCTQCLTSQNTLAYEQSRKSIYSSYEHPLMSSYLYDKPTMSSRSAQLTTFLTQPSSMDIHPYMSLKSVSTAWEHLSRIETESSFEQLYRKPSRVMPIQVDQSSSLYPLPSQYFFSSHSILIDTKPLSDLHLATSVSENGSSNSLISTTPIIPDHTHEVQSTDIFQTPTQQTSVLFSVTPSEPISHKPGSLISSRIPITRSSKTRKSHSSFDLATLLISESLKTAIWLTTQSHYATKSSLGSYQTGDLILSTTSQPYHITSKYPTFKSSTKFAPRKSRLHQSSSVIPSKTLTTPDGGIQVPVTSDLEHSATIVTSLHSNATYLISPQGDDWTVLGIHFGLFIFVVVSGIVVIGTIIFVIIGLILRKQHRSWSPMFDDRISIMKPVRFDKHGLESPFPDSDILRDEKMMEETEPGLQSNGATPLTTNPECFTSNPSDLDGCIVPIDQLREEELKFPWIEDTKL